MPNNKTDNASIPMAAGSGVAAAITAGAVAAGSRAGSAGGGTPSAAATTWLGFDFPTGCDGLETASAIRS